MNSYFKSHLYSFQRTLIAVVIFLLLLALIACATPQHYGLIKTGNDQFARFLTTPKSGPAVEYYISQPKQRSPLVIYLQGSGCTPVFPHSGFGDDHTSTIFSSTTMARTQPVAVMVINKPYAPQRALRDGGVAINCPKEFNDYFSLDTWVDHIQVAYDHAIQLPWVDPLRVLIIGISEGGTVAAKFAAKNSSVTAVALVGGSGPTQYYDFVLQVYTQSRNPAETIAALEQLDKKRAAIMAAPNDTTKFEWGHTYKRWSSFFSASSLANLAKSKARIYLVSGTADTSVPILSTEVLFSELLWRGKDITFKRVPGGSHSLMREGTPIEETEAEYLRILQWFLRTQ